MKQDLNAVVEGQLIQGDLKSFWVEVLRFNVSACWDKLLPLLY